MKAKPPKVKCLAQPKSWDKDGKKLLKMVIIKLSMNKISKLMNIMKTDKVILNMGNQIMFVLECKKKQHQLVIILVNVMAIPLALLQNNKEQIVFNW